MNFIISWTSVSVRWAILHNKKHPAFFLVICIVDKYGLMPNAAFSNVFVPEMFEFRVHHSVEVASIIVPLSFVVPEGPFFVVLRVPDLTDLSSTT